MKQKLMFLEHFILARYMTLLTFSIDFVISSERETFYWKLGKNGSTTVIDVSVQIGLLIDLMDMK